MSKSEFDSLKAIYESPSSTQKSCFAHHSNYHAQYPPYAITIIRLAFGSKRQTGKMCRLYCLASRLNPPRLKPYPARDRREFHCQKTLNTSRCETPYSVSFGTQNSNVVWRLDFFGVIERRQTGAYWTISINQISYQRKWVCQI